MFKLFHPLEGTIINPHTLNSSCILISRHDHVVSFISTYFQSNLPVVAGKLDQWGDLGVDGWIILGWISKRWYVGIWTGLGWPRIETGGRRL